MALRLEHEQFSTFTGSGKFLVPEKVESYACSNLGTMDVPEGLVKRIPILEVPAVALAHRWLKWVSPTLSRTPHGHPWAPMVPMGAQGAGMPPELRHQKNNQIIVSRAEFRSQKTIIRLLSQFFPGGRIRMGREDVIHCLWPAWRTTGGTS